jgi:hypothetical protein
MATTLDNAAMATEPIESDLVQNVQAYLRDCLERRAPDLFL